jgi:hypothetical protein
MPGVKPVYIVRDEDGDYFVSSAKPIKVKSVFDSYGYHWGTRGGKGATWSFCSRIFEKATGIKLHKGIIYRLHVLVGRPV